MVTFSKYVLYVCAAEWYQSQSYWPFSVYSFFQDLVGDVSTRKKVYRENRTPRLAHKSARECRVRRITLCHVQVSEEDPPPRVVNPIYDPTRAYTRNDTTQWLKFRWRNYLIISRSSTLASVSRGGSFSC